MKKYFYTLIVVAFIASLNAQTSNRYEETQKHFNESETVFEGYFLKKNPSFINSKKQVFTLSNFKVTQMIKGTMPPDSIIKIETEDGEALDPETGNVIGGYNSHGNGFINSSKAIFYLYPKNERDNNNLKRMIDISNSEKIKYSDIEPYNPQPYIKLADLYSDLSKISNKTLIAEKKSLVKENEENNSIEIKISSLEKSKNYNDLINTKIKLINVGNKSTQVLVNDLTVQIINPLITSSAFEFDLNIKADNNATYLDNIPVKISFNNTVFNSSVVAIANVTVTNGSQFNNINYYPANSYVQDINSSSFQFLISAIVTNPIRTQITTTYKQLAHVKLGIVNCGLAAVSLTDAAVAINACLYTSSATSSGIQFYNTLTYNGGILNNNITFCPPTIKDFNSPINAGLNQILTIKGTKFGTARGNGQVKFRHADNFGFPYLNKLDNLDYVSWNDTIIKLKVPSTIDTLPSTSYNTPGSGNFRIITNTGDSVTSSLNLASKTFSVYYSIFSLRPSASITALSRNQKLKANLFKSNPVTGGYLVRMDTSVSNDPLKVMCVKKAIKDWACISLANIKLGTDTIYSGYGISDKICNITMANQSSMTSANTIAETKCIADQLCASNPPIRLINDFDIRINKGYLNKFFYDTIGSNLPSFKIDFLETMYHEIGHGLGLMHVTDSSDMMYYRTLGNISTVITGSQRRHLVLNTSAPDGAYDQVVTSLANVNGQCNFQDMIQVSSGSCGGSAIGIKKLLSNGFNTIIYPNPTLDGKVNISFDSPNSESPTIEIYDVVGKIIYSEILPNEFNKHYNNKLDLNNISNGIYILSIKISNNIAVFKIIKN